MDGFLGGMKMGKVIVDVSKPNEGFPPEYWAERLADKIIHVSADAPEPIRLQAMAFREEIKQNCLHYIRLAIASARN